MDEKEKIKKSDYVIKNDSSIEELEKRIKNILYNFLLQL
jgi:dephospho-CoA kinase